MTDPQDKRYVKPGRSTTVFNSAVAWLARAGVSILGSINLGQNNTIQGNYIGTNAAGTALLPAAGGGPGVQVLARQPVDRERPHPFTAAGDTEFNCLLWMPATGRRAAYAGEDAGVLYLVMDYLDGADLSRVLDRHGPLPPASASS